MARPKTYHIILSDNEVSALRKVIRDKKTCKTVLKRCQILLELDEVSGTGLTHSQIAHTYAVCPATVSYTHLDVYKRQDYCRSSMYRSCTSKCSNPTEVECIKFHGILKR